MSDQEFLAHFGTPGMKWGKRKGSTTTVSKTHKPPVTAKNGKYFDAKGHEISSDAARKVLLNQKKLKTMSNIELKNLNERLTLEKQFNDLKFNDRQTKSGLNFVKQVTSVGTTVAALYGLSQTPLAKDVAKLIKSKLG